MIRFYGGMGIFQASQHLIMKMDIIQKHVKSPEHLCVPFNFLPDSFELSLD